MTNKKLTLKPRLPSQDPFATQDIDLGELLGIEKEPEEEPWKYGYCSACAVELCPDLRDSKTKCVNCIRKENK